MCSRICQQSIVLKLFQLKDDPEHENFVTKELVKERNFMLKLWKMEQ